MNISGGKMATRPRPISSKNPYSKRGAAQGPRSLAYFKPFLTVGSFHQRGGNFLQKPAKLNISKTDHNHSADHGVGDDDGPARDERSKRMCSPSSCDAITIQQFLPHQWDNLTGMMMRGMLVMIIFILGIVILLEHNLSSPLGS